MSNYQPLSTDPEAAKEHGLLDLQSEEEHQSKPYLTITGTQLLAALGLVALLITGYRMVCGRDSGLGIGANQESAAVTGGDARPLIDPDTPQEFRTKPAYQSRSKMQLVFSDEFNAEGRSFYPGDDPFWEAADLHYWATNDLEYYHPGAVTTKAGALEITLSKKESHGLHYESGMLNSWNKFCFTGGLVETAVTLPGSTNIMGLWPAVWMMGNLGRVGYGASLDGLWPYSYDACDVGTVSHQTHDGVPSTAISGGDVSYDGAFSALPGQRLSRCTCPGEVHPGPKHSDGTFVGRSAPEIDLFEGMVNRKGGSISQSAQFAPFNAQHEWFNKTNLLIPNSERSELNGYKGGAWQQSMSVVSDTNQDCYQLSVTGCFAVYGVEYKPGFDDAYISWLNDGKLAWTMLGGGLAADEKTQISARPVSMEPMYLIANLAMSQNFGLVEFEELVFPAKMRIDYIRVYQPEDAINVGCDPKDFPTAAYIEQFPEAYHNVTLTSWEGDYKQKMPKNSFLGEC